jgi:citrate lyase subunit beta / citryl-CoA lyase
MATVMVPRHEVRPIRSLVYVAAAADELVHRAVSAGADALFFDLEEPRFPFGPADREQARRRVGEYLAAVADPDGAPRNFVRVNSPQTGLTLGDLGAVMSPALTGILLPKTSRPRDVHILDGMLTCLESETGLPVGSTHIFPFLETAEGIRNAYEIASASERVTVMGGMYSRFGDVYQALRARWSPLGQESLYLRSKVLLDARAAGIRYPVSGVWAGASGDTDGMLEWARGLRDLGYFGILTGPDDVEAAHEVFTPTPADIAFWTELSDLGESAVPGGAAVRFTWPDGEPAALHEAYVASARMNLRWAQELGLCPDKDRHPSPASPNKASQTRDIREGA